MRNMKCMPLQILNSSSGGVILAISTLISILLLMTTASFLVLDENLVRMAKIGNASKTLIVAQGMKDHILAAAQMQLRINEASTAADMQTRIMADLPSRLPAGFEIGELAVTNFVDTPLRPITVGTFRGMPAIQKEFEVSYEIKKSGALWFEGDGMRMSLTLHFAKLSPLQFGQFWDLPTAEIYWNGGTNFNMSAHSNGDLCISSGFAGPLDISGKLTVVGRAMNGADPRCRVRNSLAWDNFTRIRTPSSALFNWTRGQGVPGGGNTNGCTNCGGVNQPWMIYSQWHLEGQVIDSALRASSMKMPEAMLTQTQRGLFGSPSIAGDHQQSNQGNLRFLVDPPLVGDTNEVANLKFSRKADIRIIDGVWYLKDPANIFAWPGVPIWSDHPGRKMDRWGQSVGQLDLRGRWSWTGTPERFSPYRYDDATSRMVPTETGALFYGGSTSLPGTPPYRVVPQFFHGRGTGHAVVSPLCPDPRSPGVNANAVITGFAWGHPTSSATCVWSAAPPTSLPIETRYLLATRQGFIDRNLPPGAHAPGPTRNKILPANLSLKRLSEALATTTAGELGSYFGSGNFMDRNFNGIVYISMSWPGSDTGFGVAANVTELEPPFQGAAVDANQLVAKTDSEQQALPYQLCSEAAAFIGRPYDQDSAGGTPVVRFRVPDCARYGRGGGQIGAYANAIRIVEGEDLSSFSTAGGLTIASNIPVYVDSGLNTIGWVPTLIAGDQVIYMNGYATSRLQWGNRGSSGDGGAQYWNAAFLGGWNTDPAFPGGTANIPGRIDNWAEWRANQAHITGSTVIGWHPVYYRTGFVDNGTAPSFMQHETRFHDPITRPPGAPEIWVGNVKQWQRF